MATQKERLDKHDKQIAAIRTLIQQGMRMLVEDRRLIMNLHKDMRALAAVQKRTEETLQAFIKSRHHGGNGHTKRKIDLQ